MPRLFEELKRRNVFKVGTAYVVLAWLIAQVTDVFLEPFGVPDWAIKTILVMLIAGFPLALFFAWAFELTPEGLKKEKDVDRSQSITQQTGQKLNRAIIFILIVALGYFVYDKFALAPQRDADLVRTTENAHAEQLEAAPREKSIAVLPFVNMSDDAGNEYFSDGISEEILNSLAKVKELKVAGRTSSFAFKGQNQDLRQIGEALGVENILEGSVRKAGAKVRITAQLIQVDDGFHLWSDTYDRELDDVFAIQDEIATAILVQLKAQLLEDGQVVIAASPVVETEAYDKYLLARQRIYDRSRPSLEAAADLLDQAIAIDPGFAPAYAQRGITALLLSDQQYGVLTEEQSQTQARLYLDQALRLDPQLPEALAGLGLYYLNIPGKTAESIDTLDRALAINPSLINASLWLQIAYGDAGRSADAIQILEQMNQRDPLFRPGIVNLNGYYLARRDWDRAQAMVDKVRPFMPNDPFLLRMEAGIQYAKGNVAKALVLNKQALEIQPDNGPNIAMLGMGLMRTGQFEQLAEEAILPWQRAVALWVLGRTEEATILAWEMADSGKDVTTLIGLLANSGRQEKAIQFFEQRWGSLDAFEKEYPPLGNGDIGSLLDLAFAYSSVGNAERFDEAMAHARSSFEAARELGFKNSGLIFSESVYFTLAGERDKALVLLSEAVDQGYLQGTNLSFGWDALKVLEGDPEYEAIQARMFEHLNAERAELGLEPVS